MWHYGVPIQFRIIKARHTCTWPGNYSSPRRSQTSWRDAKECRSHTTSHRELCKIQQEYTSGVICRCRSHIRQHQIEEYQRGLTPPGFSISTLVSYNGSCISDTSLFLELASNLRHFPIQMICAADHTPLHHLYKPRMHGIMGII